MSDDTARGPDDGSSDMTKPNCTITTRHDELLDELAERYASRSEALRVAIEELHKQHGDDEEAAFERLLTDVGKFAARLEQIETRIDSLEETVESNTAPAQVAVAGSETQAMTDSAGPTTDNSIGEIESEVHSALLDATTPATIADLVAEIDADSIRVQDAIDTLHERGLIEATDRGESVGYALKSPS